jgi:hypothetical protein
MAGAQGANRDHHGLWQLGRIFSHDANVRVFTEYTRTKIKQRMT